MFGGKPEMYHKKRDKMPVCDSEVWPCFFSEAQLTNLCTEINHNESVLDKVEHDDHHRSLRF